jgi:hypothetical protein
VLLRSAHEKTGSHFACETRLSWFFHPEPLSRLQTIRNATLVKPIVQDNFPRKTKFTFEEAVDVWLRRWSGQYQHQIAAAYVINVRAVNHVLKEKTHVGSKQVAEVRFSKSA